MPNNEPIQPEVIIPWWQDGESISNEIKEPHFLSKGVTQFFALLKSWLLFPLQQTDALTCSDSLLNLLAWERDIIRFEAEPLSLFRKRVKFAAINAKDSGSVAGFKAIFDRLGVGIIAFKERESEDWDICTIELTDGALSESSALVQTLIEQYGRACRRYRFEVTYPAVLSILSGEFSHAFGISVATTTVDITIPITLPPENDGVNPLGINVLGINVLGQ